MNPREKFMEMIAKKQNASKGAVAPKKGGKPTAPPAKGKAPVAPPKKGGFMPKKAGC